MRRHIDNYRRLAKQTYAAVITPASKRCQVRIDLCSCASGNRLRRYTLAAA